MASRAEIPARRLQLTLHDAPAMSWLGRFDPPLSELPNDSEVRVGRWHAPTSSTARVMIESDGTERLLVEVSVRFLSQLRHALLREPGDILPVSLEPADAAFLASRLPSHNTVQRLDKENDDENHSNCIKSDLSYYFKRNGPAGSGNVFRRPIS